MKVLLHTCCGPCAVFPVSFLQAEGFEVTLFFYNPNIYPPEEKMRRIDSLALLAREEQWTVTYDDAPYEDYARVVGRKDGLERCRACYRLRLEKTARTARERGYEAFSTTLLVSPYQRHEEIRLTGDALAGTQGISFIYRDFRVGYRRGRNVARGKHVYMQKYCGCLASRKEQAGN